MAGDWIKMRADLLTHPKVVRIASALKADNLRTVGGLMSVWCLFDAHSIDGSLDGYTAEWVDEHLRWPGFCAQMAQAGWLVIEDGKLSLPQFDTHNGSSAKRRALDAERKKKVRSESASDADSNGTERGLEKRREEKSKKRVAKRAVPADWRPSDTALAWYAGKGYREDLLELHITSFLTKCEAKGYRYVDFDAAWRNSVDDDWGDVRKKATPHIADGEAAAAWAEVRAANQRGAPPLAWRHAHTSRALTALGGFYALRDMTERDASFKQRDFEKAYVTAARGLQ